MDTKGIEKICTSFRVKLKSLLLQAGFARILILSILLMLPVVILDWWVHLPTLWRSSILTCYILILGTTLWFSIFKPIRRIWTNREILNYLDVINPGGEGVLQDTYELLQAKGIQELEEPTGKALAQSAIDTLIPKVKQFRLSQSFSRVKLNRILILAGLIGVLFAGASFILDDYAKIGCERFFNPFSTQRWPHRTTIEVATPPTGWSVPQMEAFTISAEVTGDIPAHVTLVYQSPSGYPIKEKIQVRNGHVDYTFPEVREPVSLRIEGGDTESDDYLLKVIERPYLKSVKAIYTYPVYAGLPDKETDSGQLLGLEGTQVRLVFEASLELQKARFVLDGAEPVDLLLNEDKKNFEKDIMLTKDGVYAIELYDTFGFREPKPERFEIKVIPDNLPEVELLAPNRDIVATKNVSIDIAFKAKDDFGLKQVEVLYQEDGKELLPLSDRITGPIKQVGRSSEAHFSWDLRKMETLVEKGYGNVTLFIRVQDINPTGRGKAETSPVHIKLVRPSEFQLEALENSKGLLGEGLIAWKNQLESWKLSADCLGKGTGKEDDPLWRDMSEKQENALRAVRSMNSHLHTIVCLYESNHMEREFMSVRLGRIADTLKNLTETECAMIAESLKKSRPKNEKDAMTEQLKTLRTNAIHAMKDNQKKAVLLLDRVLRQAYDWRDLQTTTVTTTLLYERQGEVAKDTEVFAPKTIGKELQDLADNDVDFLTTLGKQQRAIFDTETQLETQLTHQMYKAEKQGRKSILNPLKTAYESLRSKRVNDRMKESAAKIEDNQCSMILDKQKESLRALEGVKSELVQAGQKLDPEEPLNLAMVVNEKAKFEDVEQTAEKKTDEPQNPESVTQTDPVQQLPMEAALQEGGDAVTTSIREALDKEEDVLGRTRYLMERLTTPHMPRYVKLKIGRLLEWQTLASRALENAQKHSEKSPQSFKDILTQAREEFKQSESLLNAKDISPNTQQLQEDVMSLLKDTIQIIAFEKSINDIVSENKQRNGLDAFNQKFLLSGKDLDLTAEILSTIKTLHVMEKDVAKKMARFVKFPTKEPIAMTIDKESRARVAQNQNAIAKNIEDLLTKAGSLSPEALARIKEVSLAALRELKLAPLSAAIAAGTKDAETLLALEDSIKAMAIALLALRDVLEERVQIKKTVAGTSATEEGPKKVTAEEIAQNSKPTSLAEKIKSNTALPEEIRAKMVNALGQDFPPKYKQLLAAYYGSFEQGEKKP